MSPIRRSESTPKAVDWKIACVIASAFCMLVLSTPGVSVVRASDDIASTAGGQTCEVDSRGDVKTIIEFPLDRLHRDKTDQLDPLGEPSYALNNTGFNYRSEPATRPQAPQPRPGVR